MPHKGQLPVVTAQFRATLMAYRSAAEDVAGGPQATPCGREMIDSPPRRAAASSPAR